MEIIVASRTSVELTKELLESSHDALASSMERLEQTKLIVTAPK